jgi:hypothetical protein
MLNLGGTLAVSVTNQQRVMLMIIKVSLKHKVKIIV